MSELVKVSDTLLPVDGATSATEWSINPHTLGRAQAYMDYLDGYADDYYGALPDHLRQLVVRCAAYIVDLSNAETLAAIEAADTVGQDHPLIGRYDTTLAERHQKSLDQYTKAQERRQAAAQTPSKLIMPEPSTPAEPLDIEGLAIKDSKVNLAGRLITVLATEMSGVSPDLVFDDEWRTMNSFNAPIDAAQLIVRELVGQQWDKATQLPAADTPRELSAY